METLNLFFSWYSCYITTYHQSEIDKHFGQEEQDYSGLQRVEFDILNSAECQEIKMVISMKFWIF